jgi:hypothetical protein
MGHEVIAGGDPRAFPIPWPGASLSNGIEFLSHTVQRATGGAVAPLGRQTYYNVSFERLKQADLIILSSAEHYAPALTRRYPRWSELRMPKVAWYCESFHRDDRDFDFASCRPLVDRHYFPAIQDAEEMHGEWLPFSADVEVFKPNGASPIHSVAFLGTMYPKRAEYLRSLRIPISLLTPVSAWNTRRSFERLASAYSSTQIFLNLPALSRLLVTKVTEVMACRTMLLTPELDHPSALGNMAPFESGRHLVYYAANKPAQLAELITHYLEHDEEREAIAEAGYQSVVNHHNLEQSLTRILRESGLS